MHININGAKKEFNGEGLTIVDILKELNIEVKNIAVEHNLEIVPKGSFGGHSLKEGDNLEIVQFVGGG